MHQNPSIDDVANDLGTPERRCDEPICVDPFNLRSFVSPDHRLRHNHRMTTDWRPTASMENLRIRAEVLGTIRAFFAERGVLEVETPLLASAPVTDLHLAAMRTRFRGPGADDGLELWLQTSPEFAMKRLLAAGSGPIFQLCKAFRDGEAGSRHNPEFTMLEWYRPGWDHHRLMDEVAELIDAVLGTEPNDGAEKSELVGGAFRPRDQPVEGRRPDPALTRLEGEDDAQSRNTVDRISGSDQDLKTSGPQDLVGSERLTYHEAFQRHVGIDPHSSTLSELIAAARNRIGKSVPDLGDDRDGWLDLLMSHVIEPDLGRSGPTFIHDYPASQAALARIRPGDPPVAERFEAWVEGIELANGYHELTDPVEQRRRFKADLSTRSERGLPVVPVDDRFLEALESGIPDSSGVALGVDRLVMLAAGAERIDEVIAFPLDRA